MKNAPQRPGIGKLMPGGSMPNPLPGGTAESFTIPPTRGQAEEVNIIPRWAEEEMAQSGAKTPPGWQTETEYEDQRAQVQKREGEQVKAMQLQEQAKAMQNWLGASRNELEKANAYVAAGLKPAAAIAKVESERSAKRKEEIARKDKERKEAKTDKGKQQSESNKIHSDIAKLEAEIAATTDVKAPLTGKVTGQKPKLNEEQRRIKQAEIDRLKGRLKEMGGGGDDTTGNPRHDELLRKFESDGALTPEEQMELDGYEGVSIKFEGFQDGSIGDVMPPDRRV